MGMEDAERMKLMRALSERYVGMPDKSSLTAYQADIEPLLEGISVEDRYLLGRELRPLVVFGQKEHSLAGLGDYLDPPVTGS